MLEDIEGITSSLKVDEGEKDSLSASEYAYICECVGGNSPLTLVDRIDELRNAIPPKGIDSNREIAELIEPMKDQIDSKYLEAPSDLEQVNSISDYLLTVGELEYENWRILSPGERLQNLVNAEIEIAEIEHRAPCTVELKELPEGHYGYYSDNTKTITLNSLYVNDSNFQSYKETLETLIHEGRHAYQDYNLTERQVHPRNGEVTNWKWNENEIGYQDIAHCGFKAYAMQPVESDARAFAEDVLNAYLNKRT